MINAIEDRQIAIDDSAGRLSRFVSTWKGALE